MGSHSSLASRWRVWAWAWMIGSVLATSLEAQSFNIGAGVVRSEGLGFDEVYGLGLVEASFSYPRIQMRLGVELLNAEKTHQDGYGANLDLALTVPVTEHVGVLAFYRPSAIRQTSYSKWANSAGVGLAFTTKGNGRWDIFGSYSPSEYGAQSVGFEMRVGRGHWLRVKAEMIKLEHPSTGKNISANRVSLTVAPRVVWG